MFVTVQVQGLGSFPDTIDTVQADVSAQLQTLPGLTVQAFSIAHADRITQILEFQIYRWQYAATVQMNAAENWDADGVESAVVDAFTTVTGSAPSAVKTSGNAVDPGGSPTVPKGGWDALAAGAAKFSSLTTGLLVTVAVIAIAVVALEFKK